MDREGAAACAELDVVVDVGAIVTLAIMFAVEVPTDGPYRFGTANDALGAVHHALLAPVVVALARELPPGPARDVLTPVAVASCAVGAASSALLVAGVLPFRASTALSLVAMAGQGAWALAAGNRLRTQESSRALGELGRAIGAGTAAGAALAGVGALLPQGRARRALLVSGGVPAAAAWLAWPVWLHLAARHLRRTATTLP